MCEIYNLYDYYYNNLNKNSIYWPLSIRSYSKYLPTRKEKKRLKQHPPEFNCKIPTNDKRRQNLNNGRNLFNEISSLVLTGRDVLTQYKATLHNSLSLGVSR